MTQRASVTGRPLKFLTIKFAEALPSDLLMNFYQPTKEQKTMSYKINLKSPERKNRLQFKRMMSRSALPSPMRTRVKIDSAGRITHLRPKQGNKYILSGPACNVSSPADIYYPNGEKWDYYN
jgi:hypothetical protein